MWCGRRTGGRRTSRVIGRVDAAEATAVADSAAASSRSGSRPGIVRASSVLPEPGGPISSIAWPPASAISRARRATACPRTSARSTGASSACGLARRRPAPLLDRRRCSRAAAAPASARLDRAERTASAASATLATGTGSIPGARRRLRGRLGRHDHAPDPAPAERDAPSAGCPARGGPRRPGRARRSARSGRGPAAAAPIRAGSRARSRGRARRRPCAPPPGRG